MYKNKCICFNEVIWFDNENKTENEKVDHTDTK